MRDQPVRRPVPAARLGDREGVDLARHGAHALGLHQRRAVEAERLVEAAMDVVDAGWSTRAAASPRTASDRTRRRQAPLDQHAVGAGVNLVSSRPLFSSCSTIFLTFWLWLTGATKVASGVETMATSFSPIAESSRPVAAEIGILAIDRDDIADDDIAVLVGRADVEQRLPGTEVVPAETRRHHRDAARPFP